jgi:antitoxin ParD1/3/4
VKGRTTNWSKARQKELAHLKGLILDGVNSGAATPMTEDDWREIRTEVKRRAEERAGNKTP